MLEARYVEARIGSELAAAIVVDHVVADLLAHRGDTQQYARSSLRQRRSDVRPGCGTADAGRG